MKIILSSKKFLLVSLLFLSTTTSVVAQVGIGTVTPDVSSVLEVSSTTQGLLTPRMTTAQKMAIATPANGLMVYDTDIKAFHYYDSGTTSWIKVFSDKEGRLKSKLIKSTDVLATVLAAEKTAGGGTKYLLDSTTLYEINGTVVVDLPIELNNAYVVGLDSSDDKLVKVSGDLFTGSTGGSIRVLTLVAMGGKVFNVLGTGSIGAGTQTQSLIIRDCVVGSSSNVGTIENFLLVFVSIVQYAGNATGIVYKDISKLLLSNAGWFGNNSGTYETLQGTFGLVGKIGGFSEVNGANIGLDVSSNPIITGDAVIETVVFTGTPTTGFFVKKYTAGSYVGYNFNDFWSVRSTGIPNEGDSFTTGNLYLDRTIASPTIQLVTVGTVYKVPGTTISTNLFRMNGSTSNRLVYLGKKARTFTASASVSFEAGTGSTDVLFFFVKYDSLGVPTTITSSETFIDSNTSNVQSLSVTGTVSLVTGDYVELCAKRLNGSNKTFTIRSYNVSMK